MNQLLEGSLRRLRLSGMAQNLGVRIHEAETAHLPYGSFLENLVADELNRRSSNLYSRRLKQSQLPFLKTLDEFDFDFNPSIKKREIMELMSGRYLLEKRNVLFLGPPGVGKTHLAIAAGISAIQKGYEVQYRSIFDLLEEMSLASADGTRHVLVKKLIETPLLIIDEFGMKRIPQALCEDLLELFHRRYGLRSTMLCTNRPVEDWGKLLGDVPATGAMLDRFLEGVYLFKLTGRSYRLRRQNLTSTEKEQTK